jgi:hypothetical protein
VCTIHFTPHNKVYLSVSHILCLRLKRHATSGVEGNHCKKRQAGRSPTLPSALVSTIYESLPDSDLRNKGAKLIRLRTGARTLRRLRVDCLSRSGAALSSRDVDPAYPGAVLLPLSKAVHWTLLSIIIWPLGVSPFSKAGGTRTMSLDLKAPSKSRSPAIIFLVTPETPPGLSHNGILPVLGVAAFSSPHPPTHGRAPVR